MIAKHNSSCRATCTSAGSLWVDEGRVEARCSVRVRISQDFSRWFLRTENQWNFTWAPQNCINSKQIIFQFDDFFGSPLDHGAMGGECLAL